MRHDINHYFIALRAYDPLTGEEHARIDARVRQAVLARYGSFSIPARVAVPAVPVHTNGELPRGTLVLLRPAFAFAAVFAIVIGAFAALRSLSWRESPPQLPAPAPHRPEVIAVAPGSGRLVSVFDGATVSGDRSTVGSTGSQRGRFPGHRAMQAPLTPSEHVFGQPWGTSVFSDAELRRLEAERVSVFNG